MLYCKFQRPKPLMSVVQNLTSKMWRSKL